jgi:hypothetical protein
MSRLVNLVGKVKALCAGAAAKASLNRAKGGSDAPRSQRDSDVKRVDLSLARLKQR